MRAVVSATAALAVLGWIVGPTPWLRAALVLAAVPVAACAVIDAHVHRIPTPLVRVIAAVGIGLLGAEAAATGEWACLGRGVLAALAAGGAFGALWWFTRGGIGLGDVRLVGALALYTGWVGWGVTGGFILAAYLLAFPVAAYRLLQGRRDPMPFGPALVIGWYVAWAWVTWR